MSLKKTQKDSDMELYTGPARRVSRPLDVEPKQFVRALRARSPSWVVHRKIEFHDGMGDMTTAVVTEVVDLGQLPAYANSRWGEEFGPDAVVLRIPAGATIDDGK